ncbi:hypothetical protein [Roseibium sp. Sym1]|uniref:hypothetical protein n=1 Tax=Roseibium sp. Sym1 TaxID=3016006 RepID=UPI0022B35913|nr:hypothetical protein [Roseibium sp. Sym1]
MVFHTIAIWLLILSVPLWAYRWVLFSKLNGQERTVFKRIVRKRHESAFKFGARIFGFLLALVVGVLVLVYGLGFLKQGAVNVVPYKDVIKNRLYSGVEPIDQTLNTIHYEQPLPVAIVITCFILSVVFTLVSAAIRDISLLRRLRRKLERVGKETGDRKPA